MKRLLFIVFFSLLSATLIFAENIQFTASAPRVVEVGEQFEIIYTITAQPAGFRPPEFKGLSLLGGPSTSSSSSVQFVNGKVTQSTSISYTYYFVANNPGTFTFDPAKATVDGKNIMSNGLTLEVVGKAQGGGQQQQQNQSRTNTQPSATSQEGAIEPGGDDLFVRVLTNKTTLYQGEYLIATMKLYSRVSLSGIDKVDYPTFNGFFRQDIETKPLQQLTKENVNGQVYGTGELQKMVLFPQKSGTLTIDPFSMQAVVQIPVKNSRRSVFDDFFGPQVREVRKSVASKSIQIKVLPLPPNAPASFKGAVGNFTFKAALDRNKVKTNEAINLKITISGNGNLKVIEPLKLNFPSDFETYDPKVTVNSTTGLSGVNGTKTFEYLIIPRHSGTFSLEPVEFSYFDSKSKQYKQITSEPMEITVEKGADEGVSTVVSGVSKEEVKFIGKDIQFIKTKTPNFSPKGVFLFGSLNFYLAYLIPALLFIIAVILWRKRIKTNANVVAVRNKKAGKIAQKRLKDAHVFMKDNNREGFYEYILKAMWGYISDKLNIPASELSRDRIVELAAQKNIEDEQLQRFFKVVDHCEFARYAPSEGSGELANIYNESIDIISKIEQKIR